MTTITPIPQATQLKAIPLITKHLPIQPTTRLTTQPTTPLTLTQPTTHQQVVNPTTKPTHQEITIVLRTKINLRNSPAVKITLTITPPTQSKSITLY